MTRTTQPRPRRAGHLAAAALALLALSLLAPGCGGGSTVSDADIDHYCSTTGADEPTEPRLVQGCDLSVRNDRDAANALGCGTDFDPYFQCLRPDLLVNADCGDQYDAMLGCGLRSDPDNSCLRADAHLASCNLPARFDPNGQGPLVTGLCDGYLSDWCWARCISNADCPTLQIFENPASAWPTTVDQCQSECIRVFGAPPSIDFTIPWP